MPVSGRAQSRLEQLLAWCGEQFDGCIIFDECHKAKNLVSDNDAQSAKTAVAVRDLQRRLPKARVVYCSATGVTAVNNMAFMERLGLWGRGTTFPDFSSFANAIENHGLGTDPRPRRRSPATAPRVPSTSPRGHAGTLRLSQAQQSCWPCR